MREALPPPIPLFLFSPVSEVRRGWVAAGMPPGRGGVHWLHHFQGSGSWTIPVSLSPTRKGACLHSKPGGGGRDSFLGSGSSKGGQDEKCCCSECLFLMINPDFGLLCVGTAGSFQDCAQGVRLTGPGIF